MSKLNWRFTQVFGDKTTVDSVAEEDIISAITYDQSGKFLSLGDRAGRLIIFEKGDTDKKKGTFEYQYLTELQSHIREFDCLK